jgi:hypothetical protein
MNAQNNPPPPVKATIRQPFPFVDLRTRNERRANVARLLDTERRKRVERVMQAARQRRFRQRG